MSKTTDSSSKINKSDGDSNSTHTINWRLYLTACGVNLLGASSSCFMSWTSPTIPLLMAPDSPLPITQEEGGKLAYYLGLGAIFGPCLLLFTMDTFGRRTSIFCVASTFLLAWILLYIKYSIELLCAARFIGGVAFGMLYTVVPVFIVEISEVRIRSALVSTIHFFTNLGYIVEYGIGPFVSYEVLIIISACITGAYFLFSPFIRESPYYLAKKGRDEEAKAVLMWYRGGTVVDNIIAEMATINEMVSESRTVSWKQRLIWLLTDRANLRALFLSFGLYVFMEFNGLAAAVSFVQPILIMSDVELSSSIGSIAVSIVKISSAAFLPFLTKKFGAKRMLIVSAIGMALSMSLVGMFFFLKFHNVDVKPIFWLPLASLLTYFAFGSIGFGSLPLAVISELFSPSVKVLGTALASTFNFALCFAILRVFSIFETKDAFIPFWTFSVFTLLSIPYIYYFIPDTRKMSLMDVQDWLRGKHDN